MQTILPNTAAPRTPTHRRRFILISALSFVSYLAITAAATELFGVPPWAAAIIAMVGVTKMNFWFMRRYVFPGSREPWPTQLARFVASIAAFRVAEYTAFLITTELLGLPYLPSYALILVVSFALKFVVFRNHVFGATTVPTPHA